MGHSKFQNQIQRGRLEWCWSDDDGFTEQLNKYMIRLAALINQYDIIY